MPVNPEVAGLPPGPEGGARAILGQVDGSGRDRLPGPRPVAADASVILVRAVSRANPWEGSWSRMSIVRDRFHGGGICPDNDFESPKHSGLDRARVPGVPLRSQP